MELIDKSAVVAEIEKQQRKLCLLSQLDNVELRRDAAIQNGVYCSLLSFINTLEVKEVDLEKLDLKCGKENKMQHYTTIEQSKKLVELGLNPDTADMFWQSNLNSSDRQYLLDLGVEEYFDIELNFKHCSIGDYDIPAWSLGALLEVMPESYQLTSSPYNKYQLMLINNPRFDWFNTPLEAAYNMVCWLLENGYIKKGE